MSTSASTPGSLKVVVAYLDGRRLKGYTYDFSPVRNLFHLLPQDDPLGKRGVALAMKDLKAVFFVKDFAGNPAHRTAPTTEAAQQGRQIEVIFPDGERFVGKTQGYNAESIGFFVFPLDPQSNDLRIFVVNRRETLVEFL
jgi:Family of unknown function (DUF6982)